MYVLPFADPNFSVRKWLPVMSAKGQKYLLVSQNGCQCNLAVVTVETCHNLHAWRIYCRILVVDCISFSWVYLMKWQLTVVLLCVEVQLHNDTLCYLIYERTTTKRGLSLKTSPLHITQVPLYLLKSF